MEEYFTQTSNDPYIRHKYKLVYKNKKAVIFDNYQDVQSAWYDGGQNSNYIEVLNGN
jgi:hypothetical protein